MMSSGRPARSGTTESISRSRALPTASRRVAARALGAVLAVALGSVAMTAPSPSAAETASASAGAAATTDVRLVQANIYTRLRPKRFQADVAKVLAQQPDFVTYNEVPFRDTAILAPSGYALYRDTRNRFTAATPVAWRTDRWTLDAAGTYRVSNWRGKPPGRVVELGRRFANWVTLHNADGRVVSVVSVHVAPKVRGMPDLRRGSVKRLTGLVTTLSAQGPVLVGGDFNIHYKSGIYPRDVLTTAALAPTYDTLGKYFPTGDHAGMTIDYVFNRGDAQLTATRHWPVELNSDHDAVVGGFDWQVDPASQIETVQNDPSGDLAAKRAALRQLVSSIHSAPTGATVEIATTRFDVTSMLRQARAALDRGVHVRVTIGGPYSTPRQRRLERAIVNSGDPASRFRICSGSCLTRWQALQVPKTLMMVSDAEGTWVKRHDLSRMLTPLAITSRTTATTYVGPIGLARGKQMLAALY